MKNVRRLVSNFLIIIYISFVLLIIGITTTDFFKYLLMLLGVAIVIPVYYLIIKNINWDNKIKQGIAEDNKEKIRKKMNRIKKIVKLFIYSFIIICFICGLSNDGEFIVKNIYPFFKKGVSKNELFNWIIILSPLFYINAFYSIYNAIIQIISEKYDLSDNTQSEEKILESKGN